MQPKRGKLTQQARLVMFMCRDPKRLQIRFIRLLPLLTVFAVCHLIQAAPSTIGRLIGDDEIHKADLTILPDGSGLPRGSGSVDAGLSVYEAYCSACHGHRGEAGLNDALVGGRGSLDSNAPNRTVGSYWPRATTLFDYIRRAMPYPAPGILSTDEIYAVTAYLLYENGIVAADTELNESNLASIEMPNRAGFRWTEGPAPVLDAVLRSTHQTPQQKDLSQPLD